MHLYREGEFAIVSIYFYVSLLFSALFWFSFDPTILSEAPSKVKRLMIVFELELQRMLFDMVYNISIFKIHWLGPSVN